ncbi:MAG TPA: hypothetical protein VFK02_23020 [Kofleriaceae bacterium]|nr:hypothetical protein [Kofleriaceae bacterium]
MPRDLHPTEGARYLLEREELLDGGRGARYRVAIYTPDAAHAGTASLGDDGKVELGPTGAPDELHARLVAIARLVARDAAKLRDDGLPAWPQRILRWRR